MWCWTSLCMAVSYEISGERIINSFPTKQYPNSRKCYVLKTSLFLGLENFKHVIRTTIRRRREIYISIIILLFVHFVKSNDFSIYIYCLLYRIQNNNLYIFMALLYVLLNSHTTIEALYMKFLSLLYNS